MASNHFKSVEYQDKGLVWKISPDLCKSCGMCIEKCPAKCLSYDSENLEYLGMPLVKNDIERCIACRTCELNCPDSAIEIEGKR